MRTRIFKSTPQVLTIGTLVAGMASIILSIEGYATWAGVLILVGLVTDTLDGIVARATRTSSDFGVQLDSLADIVCFGVGSSVFTYQYLRSQQLPSISSLMITLPVPVAGIFRLARFNLLPIKKGDEKYTLGLTITSAGVLLSLAVLTAMRYDLLLLPLPVVALAPSCLAALMISRIRFPTLHSIVRRRKTTVTVVAIGTLLSIQFSPQLVSFSLMLSYVGFGVARAGYAWANRQ